MLTQIRNATIQIKYADKRFLIDPFLAKKGAYPGFQGTVNSHLNNPLVDLPFEMEKILDVDAIIVTHLHPDHWDEAATKLIPKDKLIFAQNEEDAATLKTQGFTNVIVLAENTKWGEISLIKTEGQHGTDATLKALAHILGTVSGVIFKHPKEKSVYIAGDTIWNHQVENILRKFSPDVVVVNAGAASIPGFDPIIMNKEDVLEVVKAVPKSKVIAIHMEAVNHAILSRSELREFLIANEVSKNVEIPLDGESVIF